MKKQNRASATKGASGTVFVVPFFLDGVVHEMRVYSVAEKAQRALKRYVNYSGLLRKVERENHGISPKRAIVLAYAAIERTQWAGTAVYEIHIDEKQPRRKAPIST